MAETTNRISAGNNQAYEARAIIARLVIVGNTLRGPIVTPIYKFLTLYQGEGRPAIPVEFIGPAPVDDDGNGNRFLKLEALKEGDFVVDPGLVYRKCLWFDALTAAHLKAFATFKPKELTVPERSDFPSFNLGTLDTTKDQVTKQ